MVSSSETYYPWQKVFSDHDIAKDYYDKSNNIGGDLMNFKEFYKHIYFDIDKNIHSLYSAKQGDTKSRGFYVTLLVNGVVMPGNRPIPNLLR